ncbi:MAG: PD-(D/E)XK nuclease family protein [Candidatus Paceibacterota bacterium]|jgi:putative RecB family exonuclease
MSWKDLEKGSYLSHTQIAMYRRCPLQYMFRYMKGIKKPPTSSLVLGSSVHTSVEKNIGHKFEKGKPVNRNEAMDAFGQAFENGKSGIDWEGKNPDAVKDMGYNMSQVHYDKVAPTITPVEKPEFYFELNLDGVTRKVIGYIDVIAKAGAGRAVLDTKTTGKKKDQFEVDLDGQLTLYAIAHKTLFKKPAKMLGMDVLVGNKTWVQPQRIITTRGDEQMTAMVETVQAIEKAIMAGIFYPCDSKMICSWCGYSDICPSAKAAKAIYLAKKEAE